MGSVTAESSSSAHCTVGHALFLQKTNHLRLRESKVRRHLRKSSLTRPREAPSLPRHLSSLKLLRLNQDNGYGTASSRFWRSTCLVQPGKFDMGLRWLCASFSERRANTVAQGVWSFFLLCTIWRLRCRSRRFTYRKRCMSRAMVQRACHETSLCLHS